MAQSTPLTTTEKSWILYDAGNSAFVLVMVTAIMPLFFKQFAAANQTAAVSTAYWGFANSTASLILALLSPLLGTLADYKSKKKRFFAFFLTIGILFTLALTCIQQGQWLLCLIVFICARVGWAGANLFYDAFLTDVTTPEQMDEVSAKGYGYGYIGSVIPFILIIGLIMWGTTTQGELPPLHTKLGFVLVALWWFTLSLPMLKHVRQNHFIAPAGPLLSSSFSRLYATFRKIRHHRQIFLFLLAYFFYIDGVGTIISMAIAYGSDLGFSPTMLIAVLLFIQVVAFPCALLYGKLSRRFSTKPLLLAGIAIYTLITVMAFLLPTLSTPQIKIAAFWCIAFLVASSMGGIQALSRSYYGKLVPPQQSAEFFGFYNVFGKFAAIAGPFLMGMITTITGESRWGVLSIVLLFIIGGGILLKVKENTSLHDSEENSSR